MSRPPPRCSPSASHATGLVRRDTYPLIARQRTGIAAPTDFRSQRPMRGVAVASVDVASIRSFPRPDPAGHRPAVSPDSAGRRDQRAHRWRAATIFRIVRTFVHTGSPDDPNAAYAAFQRGRYLTAFGVATHRVEEKGDPKSMTLLGELYAGGLGVPQNDAKAAEWYKLAADRGDREAMFALAMFKLQGRGGPRDRDAGANGLPPPPSSVIRSRPTISRCSTWKANCFRRISPAPPNCCAPRRKQAFRKRNMRSARSTSRAAASPRI